MELPERIERWCCEGKSCGKTQLMLIWFETNTSVRMYDYVRVSTYASYTGKFMTKEAMQIWLKETEGNLNEV